MKKNLLRICLLMIVAEFTVVSAYAQVPKILRDMERTQDPEYGYISEKPIIMKAGGVGKSLETVRIFLSGLTADDGAALSVKKEEIIKGKMYELYYAGDTTYAVPVEVDMYRFTMESAANEVTLYFVVSIPRIKPLIPIGLNFTL